VYGYGFYVSRECALCVSVIFMYFVRYPFACELVLSIIFVDYFLFCFVFC
jgi:hypothetical protein